MKPHWQEKPHHPASNIAERMRQAAKEEQQSARAWHMPRIHAPPLISLTLIFALAGIFATIYNGPFPFVHAVKLGFLQAYLDGTVPTPTPAAQIIVMLVRAAALFLASAVAALAGGAVFRLKGNSLYLFWAAVLTAFFSYLWIHS